MNQKHHATLNSWYAAQHSHTSPEGRGEVMPGCWHSPPHLRMRSSITLVHHVAQLVLPANTFAETPKHQQLLKSPQPL